MHERERQDAVPGLGRAPAAGRIASAPGMTVHRAAQAMAAGTATPRTVAAVQRVAGNSLVTRSLAALRDAAPEQGTDAGAEQSFVPEVLNRPGRPLDTSIRRDLEPRMGWDFSRVRVHDDEIAVRSADELGAEAWTSGPNVVIGRGGMTRRKWIHELGHVMQQEMGQVEGTDRGDGVSVSDASDTHEKAVEDNADRILGDRVPAQPEVQVQRYAALMGRSEGPSCGHAGHDAPHVQRTPGSWARSRTVGGLRAQQADSEHWDRMIGTVERYGSLSEHALDAREEALASIESAIGTWREHRSRLAFGSSVQTRKAAVDALEPRIRAERAEIRSARERPAPSTAPMQIGGGSAPMQIGGAYGQTGHAYGGESSSYGGHGGGSPSYGASASPLHDLNPAVRPSEVGRQMANAVPLVPGVRLRLHLTPAGNAESVHRTGLRPSAGGGGIGLAAGFGEPENAGPDRHHFYTLSGSNPATTNLTHMDAVAAAGEEGLRGFGVLSLDGVTFPRDDNHPSGSYRYTGDSTPMRRAGDTDRGPFTFALPLRESGRDLERATAFVNANRPNGQRRYSPAEVRTMIHAHLYRFGPMMMNEHLG